MCEDRRMTAGLIGEFSETGGNYPRPSEPGH